MICSELNHTNVFKIYNNPSTCTLKLLYNISENSKLKHLMIQKSYYLKLNPFQPLKQQLQQGLHGLRHAEQVVH